MAKELTKETQTKALSTETSMDSWGAPSITAQDMVIPKILPLQYMSEKVMNKEGEYGEFRDTLSNQKFGDLTTPFEVIPFMLQKKWIEFEMIPQKGGGSKREFSQIVMIQDNPAVAGFNDDLPLREEDGSKERDRVMDFFVLIPDEVKAGAATPYVLSFRRTSLKAGKNMATQMYVRNAAASKVPPATVMKISGVDTSNDDGSYVVQNCVPSRPSTEEEVAAAFKWFKIIKQNGAKVDEREFGEEAPVHTDVSDF